MLKTVTLKFTEREIEILDLLVGGTYLGSRSGLIREAVLLLARKRNAINAAELLALADDRDKEHRGRRRKQSLITRKNKRGKKS
jgi:Arc/MetJ-type ribon-helix-helix transcriptional regulator